MTYLGLFQSGPLGLVQELYGRAQYVRVEIAFGMPVGLRKGTLDGLGKPLTKDDF